MGMASVTENPERDETVVAVVLPCVHCRGARVFRWLEQDDELGGLVLRERTCGLCGGSGDLHRPKRCEICDEVAPITWGKHRWCLAHVVEHLATRGGAR